MEIKHPSFMSITPEEERVLGSIWERSKPCPFCGEKPSIGLNDPGAPFPGAYYWIGCESDGCTTSGCHVDERGVEVVAKIKAQELEAELEKLLARWNTRASQ